ncbi:hypothetical protein RHGRI_007332 [Rhododendron griersonianum]|uniref:Uncharacterized protein n=1 Tax=Rhododendron griersonianum TaxID=479676 RepID=A0AAV6KY14_9ERIC|nr:hypothetical protein RHGRI_007332 [Rhododendron griersonianum]
MAANFFNDAGTAAGAYVDGRLWDIPNHEECKLDMLMWAFVLVKVQLSRAYKVLEVGRERNDLLVSTARPQLIDEVDLCG